MPDAGSSISAPEMTYSSTEGKKPNFKGKTVFPTKKQMAEDKKHPKIKKKKSILGRY